MKLFIAIAINAVMLSSEVSAAEDFYDKTFIPTYVDGKGQTSSPRFYINSAGEIHLLLHSHETCDANTYSAPLNGTKDNTLRCQLPSSVKYQVFMKVKSRVNASVITWDSTTILSSQAGTPPPVTHSDSFEVKEDGCIAVSSSASGMSRRPVSCTVLTGRAAAPPPPDYGSEKKAKKP